MNDIKRTRTDDFLLAILQISERDKVDRVQTGKVAAELNITKGTCSTYLKQLAADGLLDLELYNGVILTNSGHSRCDSYKNRLHLIEWMLNEILPVDSVDIADDAWLLEPGLSSRLELRISDAKTRKEMGHE